MVAGIFVFELAGGLEYFRKGMHLHAQFHNVQDLKRGDQVKMAGVPIGYVEKLEIANDKVDVSMKVSPSAGVKTSSTATIKFMGMMGQNYVAIEFGTNATLATEGTMLTSVEQPDMSQLIARISNVAGSVEDLTKSFSGGQLDKILGPMNDILSNNKEKVGVILGNLQSISTMMASGNGTVGKMLKDETLYNQALAAVDNLNATAGIIQTNVNQVMTSTNGTLGKLLHDEKLYSETTAAMVQMRQIMEKINHGEGSVGKLVNDDSLINNAKLTLQKLDKATDSLEDTGPMSLFQSFVTSLF
jgi:phospholipid/cholesterol/gamma-HCH transport system substrate-binding protein